MRARRTLQLLKILEKMKKKSLLATLICIFAYFCVFFATFNDYFPVMIAKSQVKFTCFVKQILKFFSKFKIFLLSNNIQNHF